MLPLLFLHEHAHLTDSCASFSLLCTALFPASCSLALPTQGSSLRLDCCGAWCNPRIGFSLQGHACRVSVSLCSAFLCRLGRHRSLPIRRGITSGSALQCITGSTNRTQPMTLAKRLCAASASLSPLMTGSGLRYTLSLASTSNIARFNAKPFCRVLQQWSTSQ